MTNRLLALIFCAFSIISNAQIVDMLPILSDPQVILDREGKVVFTLSKGEDVINALDGRPDMGWVEGMADIDIGICGNIITYNYETKKHHLYDSNGKLIRIFRKEYFSITPCSEGYHVACYVEKRNNWDTRKTYQYLDTKGSVLFAQEGYVKADAFVGGLAAVNTKEGKWVYINDLGHELKLIPESIENINNVTSFYNGVSVITTWNKRKEPRNTYNIYLLNKKGEIIFESDKAFNGKPVKRVSRFHDGILSVQLYKENGLKEGHHIVYLNTKGEVIVEGENLYSFNEPKGGFILMRSKTSKNAYNNHVIYNIKGKEVSLPKKNDSESGWIHHINDQYFKISYRLDKKSNRSIIYDADLEKSIYDLEDDVMGVKNDLISLVNSSSKRYFVVNKNSKNIVYDTQLENQVVRDLGKNINQADQIKTFICTKLEDVEKLGQLSELIELTIRIQDLKKMPDLSSLTKLKTLRLDGCRQLEELPTYLNTLTQLSLRDCTSANNLIEMVDAQKNLERLFIINFDISRENKQRIQAKYPDAEISGTSKNADSMLQMEVFGF